MGTAIEIGGYYKVGGDTGGSYEVALREGARYIVARYGDKPNATRYVFEILGDEEITSETPLLTPTPRFANYTTIGMDGIYDTFERALEVAAKLNKASLRGKAMTEEDVARLELRSELHAWQVVKHSEMHNLLRLAYTKEYIERLKGEQA